VVFLRAAWAIGRDAVSLKPSAITLAITFANSVQVLATQPEQPSSDGSAAS